MSLDRTLAITERIIRQILRDRRSIGLLVVGPLIVMSLVGFSLYEQRAVLDRVAPGLLAVFVLFFTFILTGVGFIRQILRDRRSIGLLVVGPLIVMSLVGFSLYEQRAVLDRVAPGLLAVFVLFFTFILTGVGFLRERAQGTLERLQTTLVGSFDIMLGYMLGFLIFAIVQTVVILLFTIFALKIEYVGSLWEIGVVLFLLVTVAVSLGIFISSFANNEFQVVQFIPIVLAPQIFLSGVIIPVEQMPALFEWLSVVIPLTYAVDALQEIMLLGTDLTTLWLNLAVIAAFSVALLAAAVATLRR